MKREDPLTVAVVIAAGADTGVNHPNTTNSNSRDIDIIKLFAN